MRLRRSARLLQPCSGVLQHRVRNPASGEHAREFLGSLLAAFEVLRDGDGAPAAFELFDVEVVVREARDLGKVGDAQHLRVARQALEALADGFRYAPADSRVNLVEDEGGCYSPRRPSGPTACSAGSAGTGPTYYSLESQHQAREFPARGDLFEGAWFLAGIGRDPHFDFVNSASPASADGGGPVVGLPGGRGCTRPGRGRRPLIEHACSVSPARAQDARRIAGQGPPLEMNLEPGLFHPDLGQFVALQPLNLARRGASLTG